MDKDYSELTQYLDERFSKIEIRLDKIDERINQLVIAIDKLTQLMSVYHDEYIALTSKVDKHEKWFQQIAEKLGLKLEY